MNKVTVENIDGKQVVEIDGKQYALTELEQPKLALKLRPVHNARYSVVTSVGTISTHIFGCDSDREVWNQGNGFFTEEEALLESRRREVTKQWLDAIATVNHERGYTPVFDDEQPLFQFEYWDIGTGPRFAGFYSFLHRPLTHCFHKDDLPYLRAQFSDDDIKLIYLGE